MSEVDRPDVYSMCMRMRDIVKWVEGRVVGL
jgi:hypothetical protein